MCLDVVDQGLPPEEGLGWKVIRAEPDAFGTCQVYCRHGMRLVRKVWLRERDYRPDFAQILQGLVTLDGQRYPFGWHVLRTRKDAREWRERSRRNEELRVVRVRYRKPVAIGTQEACHVIVAQEIMFL